MMQSVESQTSVGHRHVLVRGGGHRRRERLFYKYEDDDRSALVKSWLVES